MKYEVPISVVMPYYNNERYISEAIKSILQQSFSDFEFIIVNDGSNDSSASKLMEFNDTRIKHLQLRKNNGNYVARNIGMAMSKGKYICAMDADDIACLERLQIQYTFMETHPTIGLIGSQGEYINEDGEVIGKKIEKPVCSTERLRAFLLINNFTLHPSLMFRANLMRKYNLYYDEHFKIASDYDFVTRWAELFPIRNINERLIKYRTHNMQISTKSRQLQEMYADKIRLKQLKKIFTYPSAKTKELYLKLIRRSGLEKVEYSKAETLLNNILKRNDQLRLFDRKCLYELFDYLLYVAIIPMDKY